ncbi:MAG: metal-dependent hydrolase [Betaproteobacteria bacterium]|nr:metal-dependent hydrolase [Betaproteobacteria bacterium]
MDTLTHALSGALLARATAPAGTPRATPRRVAAGFFAYAAPDLDFVIGFIGPVEYLLYHRGPTHSLLLAPLWAFPIAWLLAKILREPGGLARALRGVPVLPVPAHRRGLDHQFWHHPAESPVGLARRAGRHLHHRPVVQRHHPGRPCRLGHLVSHPATGDPRQRAAGGLRRLAMDPEAGGARVRHAPYHRARPAGCAHPGLPASGQPLELDRVRERRDHALRQSHQPAPR